MAGGRGQPKEEQWPSYSGHWEKSVQQAEVGTRQPSPIILPRMSSQPTASIYAGLGSQSVPYPAPPMIPSHWQCLGVPGAHPPTPHSFIQPSTQPCGLFLLSIPQFFSLLSILSAAAWPRPPPSLAALHASLPPSQVSTSQPETQLSNLTYFHGLPLPEGKNPNCPGGPRGPSQSGASAEPRQSDRVHAWALEPHCLSRLFTGCETGPQFAHLLNGDVRVNHRKLLFFVLQPIKGSHLTERAGSEHW